tara:strand:- start:2209 stop:3489 length:1281 start_codon:yes stop_codon:yes gene_type:complete
MNKNLLYKLKSNRFSIGIIGLGYVGLPLSLKFVNKKINVIGFDINSKIVKQLNLKKKLHIDTIDKKFLNKNFKEYFYATTNFEKIKYVDVIIICVPTPIKNNKVPDLSFLKNTIKSIYCHLKKDQILCLESTTYPGTTRELFGNQIKKKFQIGKEFYIGYSPERENPGKNSILEKKIPKVCSGYTSNCLKMIKILYEKILPVKTVKSLEIAEMTKLHENIYRTINISYVNEMKMICHAFNLDIYDVISAAKTKPFGFNAFYPGPGIGGHCIPVDPFYLVWACKKKRIKTEFINLSGRINDKLAPWILKKIKSKLNEDQKKCLLIGLSYKKNIGDTRESPSFKIADLLLKSKFKVDYHDPYLKSFPKQRSFNFRLAYKSLNRKNIRKYDFIIILTDHDNINYELLKSNSNIIFDTRGRIKGKNVISI